MVPRTTICSSARQPLPDSFFAPKDQPSVPKGLSTPLSLLLSPAVAPRQVHSARPYTVKVSSPDPLADDPDRWRRLFAQFGHVSYVTVCRGNGALLRALADRRKAGRKLEGSTANLPEVCFFFICLVDDEDRGRGLDADVCGRFMCFYPWIVLGVTKISSVFGFEIFHRSSTSR